MGYTDLIQLYFERSNALQWYWTLYVVIIGGLLAFTSLRQRRDTVTEVLVSVLFCFFAYKNLGAIHDVTDQRMAMLQAIHQFPPVMTDTAGSTQARTLLEPTLVAPVYDGIRNFHITCDVLTVAALWAMELRRIKLARAAASK